jgi:hypothetical protein
MDSVKINNFQKPSAYKNVNTSSFTIIDKKTTLLEKNYQKLLNTITTYPTQQGSCTCS